MNEEGKLYMRSEEKGNVRRGSALNWRGWGGKECGNKGGGWRGPALLKRKGVERAQREGG